LGQARRKGVTEIVEHERHPGFFAHRIVGAVQASDIQFRFKFFFPYCAVDLTGVLTGVLTIFPTGVLTPFLTVFLSAQKGGSQPATGSSPSTKKSLVI
jgi:hypothetical protein